MVISESDSDASSVTEIPKDDRVITLIYYEDGRTF